MAKRGPKVGSKDGDTANYIRTHIKFVSVPANVKEMAEHLGIRPSAVNFHIRKLYGSQS